MISKMYLETVVKILILEKEKNDHKIAISSYITFMAFLLF